MIAPVGSEVTFYEEIAGVAEEIGKAFAVEPPAGGPMATPRFPGPEWRCDRPSGRIHRRRAQARHRPPRGLQRRAHAQLQRPFLIQTPSASSRGAGADHAQGPLQIGDVSGACAHAHEARRERARAWRSSPREKTLSFKPRRRQPRRAHGPSTFIVAGTHHHQRLGVGPSRRPRRARSRSSRATR